MPLINQGILSFEDGYANQQFWKYEYLYQMGMFFPNEPITCIDHSEQRS